MTRFWLEHDGGPFVMLKESLLANWFGAFPQKGQSITHYDLACQVNDLSGIIEVERKQALVINDFPMSLTLLPSAEGDVRLLRWLFADSDAEILSAAEFAGDDYKRSWKISLEITEARNYIFSASSKGEGMVADGQ